MSTSEFEQLWRRFVEGGRTGDYFDALHRWAAGRTPLAAFAISLEPFPEVTEAIRREQLPLRNVAGIDFVPPHLLRVVVLTVGFVGGQTGAEQISAADLEALGGAARPVMAALGPVTLRLGAAGSSLDTVFVEVEDGGAVAGAWRALAPALPPALRPPAEARPYPRVDIAYYTGPRPSREAVSVLEAFREAEVGRVEVGAVDLVTTPVIRARRFAPPTLLRRYYLGDKAP